MTTSAQTLAVLKRSREFLTPPGAWLQKWTHQGSRYCLAGAIWKARDTLFQGMSTSPMFDACRVAAGVHRDADMMLWNDAPGRTQAEVLAVLDKAIEEAGRG